MEDWNIKVIKSHITCIHRERFGYLNTTMILKKIVHSPS